jgi:UDP-2,4-diacetamido-2,4,6-trideoxy-beta-L-altropyranose hydrolase
MTVCFRCDANSDIGYGHFYRCLSLADAIHQQGFTCLFIMANTSDEIIKIFNNSRHKLIEMHQDKVINNVGEAENSQLFIEHLTENQVHCQLLIIDNYQIQHQWMMDVKSTCNKIMLLNDAGKLLSEIDIIWDASCSDESEYKHLNKKTKLLTGPKYALLREEFQRRSENQKLQVHRSQIIQPFQLMIAIGATDPSNTTKKLLSWLSELSENITFTILSTTSNQYIPDLKKEFSDESFKFFIDCQNIADIMQNQHLIITAAGNMMWESFSLGIPCAILKTCANQSRNITFIKSLMKEVYLGQEQTLNKAELVYTLLQLINNTEKLSQLSKQVLSICDGQGAIRTAEIIAKEIRG